MESDLCDVGVTRQNHDMETETFRLFYTSLSLDSGKQRNRHSPMEGSMLLWRVFESPTFVRRSCCDGVYYPEQIGVDCCDSENIFQSVNGP